jgi:Tfp pilus assembly protein PilN
MADAQCTMPADFLADRRAEGERLRGKLIWVSCQLAVIVGFALVVLLPLAAASRAQRSRAAKSQLLLREARATTFGLKTRERRADRFQAQYAAIEQAQASRRLWLAMMAGMANHLPADTWLTGAACGEDKQGIKAEVSGACWSLDRLPILTAAWAQDENTQAANLKSIRSVIIDGVPAVRFELAIRYGADDAEAGETAP